MFYLHEKIYIFSVSDDGNFNATTCIVTNRVTNIVHIKSDMVTDMIIDMIQQYSISIQI
jgi:hypothetical protein